MNYETVSKVFTLLYEQDKIRDKWISNLPNDISGAFYDNDYVDSFHKSIEFLLNQLFINDERILSDIEYFLYECGNGGKIITAEGEAYVFTPDNFLEETLKYFKEVYFKDKVYTSEVYEFGQDNDLMIRLPEELIEELNWYDGDTVEWIDNKDDSFTISKNKALLLNLDSL